MNIKWNAQGYTKDFQFVHQYGEDVLNLLDIEKGMKILDLGCGNGALTKKMADMGANVIGMDASKDMLEVAKSTYPELTFINEMFIKGYSTKSTGTRGYGLYNVQQIINYY